MFKYKSGPITNISTHESKEIIAAISKTDAKDILIGCGIIAMGTAYLVITSFKNGAKAFELAEYNTLNDLKILR